MQRMGLTRAELRAYHKALRDNQTRRVRVAVQNLDGETLAHLTPTVLDGQVIVDLDAEVTRTLTMQFLDPNHALNFDSDSPDDGALYADRMLRVYYSVRVPDLGRHVSCVVFTGPLVKLDRNGDVVTIEAHGKERLALGELWRPLAIKKGTPKVDAVRTLMDQAGETRYAFPTLKTRLPKRKSVNRFQSAWKVARHIAHSMDRQLFYPGNGICTMRHYPRTPLFTFNTGERGEVVSDVAISNTMDDFRNVVLVVGGKPKGAKHRVRARAIAPKHHPLSPDRLGRNGQPRFMVEKIEDDSIRSRKEARRRAERVLEDRLRSVAQVTFDSVPIPHLDPGDWVRVRTDDGVVSFRLRQFSIPLGTEGEQVMPIGYLKKTDVSRRRIRR